MKLMGREERTYDMPEDMELRVEGDDKATISGYAAVFNKKSLPLGFIGFREIIKPGAFRNALKNADVRALLNHDPSLILGRTSNGTLTLAEDEKGLRTTITPPDTTAGRDATENIRLGNISHMSFSFLVGRGGDEWDESGRVPVRTINTFEDLFDVSPVTFPAYTQTSVKARSMTDTDLDWDAIIGAMTKRDQGFPVSEVEYRLIEDTIETLRSYLPVPELPEETDPVRRNELQRFLDILAVH